MKRAIYVVDDKYVVRKIERLMTIQGDIGFVIKVGLSHSREICPDNAGHKCDRLHVINKPNGMELSKVLYTVFHRQLAADVRI
ncbi:MAG TPA: hypothetical protein VIR31_01545 [Nitrososphaeraceae archaeon]